jgi:hypothetical protein
MIFSMLTKAIPFDEDPQLSIPVCLVDVVGIVLKGTQQRIEARFTQPFDMCSLERVGATVQGMSRSLRTDGCT